jgi:hypothetical protein
MMAPAVRRQPPPTTPATHSKGIRGGGDQGRLLSIAGGAPQPSIFPAGQQQSPAEEITTQHTNQRGSYRGITVTSTHLSQQVDR